MRKDTTNAKISEYEVKRIKAISLSAGQAGKPC